ncbi:helix-turn-helix domain-containing protein [Clostridium pasteurianum]|uniref:Putative transcription factor, MBF1 like protein n=1 Tax=Clostridium pasteurianum BC1 TaxID=86416 RepID=R4K035_CLOPA|nr:helix-turn-helix transcriptional regulator [Clostridium pasteurianum]AGK96447.1 putative transcription factor, MBF1 like protein [Clostridium pasteurianum BC1]
MKIYWYNGSKNIIGTRVKKARKMSKPTLTQENLAAKLDLMNIKLDRIALSRIESGDRFVSDYEVVALAKALGVSLDWLLLGK